MRVVREIEALRGDDLLVDRRASPPPPGARGGRDAACGDTISSTVPLARQGHGHAASGSGFAAGPRGREDLGMPERIGFLGLGIMGSRMAANVARAGFPLTVWTHTPGKADSWASRLKPRQLYSRRGGEDERHRGEHGRRQEPGRRSSLGPDESIHREDRGATCVSCSTVLPLTLGGSAPPCTSARSGCSTPRSPAPPPAPRTGRPRNLIMAGGKAEKDFAFM